MYAALCCEPWCFPVAVVAGLTDYQIQKLYLEPQAEAVRRAKGETPMPVADPDAPPQFPDRETYVGLTGATFGWSREKAGGEWDRMMEEWQAQRGET